jgi:hypothetical protein
MRCFHRRNSGADKDSFAKCGKYNWEPERFDPVERFFSKNEAVAKLFWRKDFRRQENLNRS